MRQKAPMNVSTASAMFCVSFSEGNGCHFLVIDLIGVPIGGDTAGLPFLGKLRLVPLDGGSFAGRLPLREPDSQ
ncbi:MAG: hypothetical protein ACYCVB_16120 [Bacilli bacterium]